MGRLAGTLTLALAAGVFVFVTAAAENEPAQKLLDKARKSIDAGKAAEATASLEELAKLFPKTPEADEGELLQKRIESIEVLFDRSHELRDETGPVAEYLRQSGIGVTLSDASLSSIEKRLGDFEMVFIWQEGPTLSFSDAEIKLLKDYVKDGGRLLAVGTTHPKGESYPLRKLLDAFACPLKGPQTQVRFGKGCVKFFENAGLFTPWRLMDARESAGEVVEVFRSIMPYEQIKRNDRVEMIPPEVEEAAGTFKLQYSARLQSTGTRVKDLLDKIEAQMEEVYKDQFPKGMTVRVLPRAASGWTGGMVFESGAFEDRWLQARGLSGAVALYGLFPGGTWISYPPWVERAWSDLIGLRACYKIGYKHEAELARKELMDAFDQTKDATTPIDLSIGIFSAQKDYAAKAQWVLETLEKKYGKNLLERFRKTLSRYHAAGKLPMAMSTRDVVFYLSQTVREDLFPYFKSIGTTVMPMKIDYNELEKK
jgi:hypothetical protein